jgi:hypothetical protein
MIGEARGREASMPDDWRTEVMTLVLDLAAVARVGVVHITMKGR